MRDIGEAVPADRQEYRERLRLRLLLIAGSADRHASPVRLWMAAATPEIDVLVAGLNRLAPLPAHV